MRLVTWNACRGPFERKLALLDGLGADIAVIQEIAAPKVVVDGVLWFGDNPRQGIAVVARKPYALRKLDELPKVPKYIIPVAVEGPNPFILFAVWTLGTRPMRYIRALSKAIDRYDALLSNHTVVFLGDFNSNAMWDKADPVDMNHSSVVARLKAKGLVSAYHHHRQEPQGQELEPTFYLQWKESKPYHLDYCFLPRPWAKKIRSVDVGSYETWKEHSDHRPLLVDVATKV
jgi:exodeoxyribonuclease III